jgi:hypothetical protein
MNKLLAIILALVAASTMAFNANAQLTCQDLDGSVVYSQESSPVYLGFFGTTSATDSIMNLCSTYGSQYNSLSVRNEYGTYGSPYNPYSVTNPYTSTPPVIYKNGSAIGYLTTGYNTSVVSLAEIDISCTFHSSVPSDGFASLPAPPCIVNASDGTYTDKIAVSWSSVSDATAYNVYYSATFSSSKSLLGQYTDTSVNVTGPAPGDIWYFWVYSVNANGESATGSYDTGSKANPPNTVPDAPTLASAEPGDGRALLSFTANGDGGSGITGYTASCGALNQSGPSSPITVSGLTNGTVYSCSVVATNAVGDSAPSAALSVMPMAPSSFQINAGLNDAWFNPATDGQGFFIMVFPEFGLVSLAWFTYDTEAPQPGVTANLGSAGHRWLTALGSIAGDEVIMDIDIPEGGLFDTVTEIQHTNPAGSDGTIILTFDNCNSGTVDYDIPSINRHGVVPIQRVVTDNVALCEALLE